MSGLNAEWENTHIEYSPRGGFGGWRPGEKRARILMVIACVLAVAVLSLSGCWSDSGSLRACRETCSPMPVAKMSSDGCVCASPCGAAADGGAR